MATKIVNKLLDFVVEVFFSENELSYWQKGLIRTILDSLSIKSCLFVKL